MTKIEYAEVASFNSFREYLLSDGRIVRRFEEASGGARYAIVGTVSREDRDAYMYEDMSGDWSECDAEEFAQLMAAIGEPENIPEIDAAIMKINEVGSDLLSAVMTAAEAVATYNLSEAAVRNACKRGSIPARKSGETWLILRADAEARWGGFESVLGIAIEKPLIRKLASDTGATYAHVIETLGCEDTEEHIEWLRETEWDEIASWAYPMLIAAANP